MRFSHSCLEIWSHKACLASEKMKGNEIKERILFVILQLQIGLEKPYSSKVIHATLLE